MVGEHVRPIGDFNYICQPLSSKKFRSLDKLRQSLAFILRHLDFMRWSGFHQSKSKPERTEDSGSRMRQFQCKYNAVGVHVFSL